MDIKIYNTLSRQKEILKPISAGEVRMYNCGPTVYDRAHIGNLRAYVFADIVRRTLEYFGLNVYQVINITDVGHLSGDSDEGEDKMTKALKRNGLPLTLEAMRQVGTKYFDSFVEDLKLLNIELPQKFPRASDHIKEDIELIEGLQKNGFTYKTSHGICFSIDKFPSYGRLGNIKIDSQKEGARVSVDAEKRNPADFLLWKFDNELGWESPWGKGFPGWHIECSAMSRKYLGQPFDIHTGGIDHISVHHNNEIAQSEAAFGVPLANYWMHNEFLTIDKEKMAKSENNFMTLEILKEEMISPLAYRYWLMTAHYRSPVDLSFKALQASQTAMIRLLGTVSEYPANGKIVPSYQEKFDSFVSDDFDTPKALALVWDLLKDTKISDADKRATILNFDKIFGFDIEAIKKTKAERIPEEIVALAEAREEARKNKDWEKADALRLEMEKRGFEVTDSNNGFKIQQK